MPESKPNIWFKRKRYGYGWTPSTWQGWLATLIFSLSLTVLIIYILDHPRASGFEIFLFIAGIIVDSLVFGLICYKKSEWPPKWKWGKDD